MSGGGLIKTGTSYPSRTPGFPSSFYEACVANFFLALCVVFLVLFVFVLMLSICLVFELSILNLLFSL